MRQIVTVIRSYQAQAKFDKQLDLARTKFNKQLDLARKMTLWSGHLHRLTGLLRSNQANVKHIEMALWLIGRLTDQFSDEERGLVTADLKQGSLEQRWAYAQKLFLK